MLVTVRIWSQVCLMAKWVLPPLSWAASSKEKKKLEAQHWTFSMERDSSVLSIFLLIKFPPQTTKPLVRSMSFCFLLHTENRTYCYNPGSEQDSPRTPSWESLTALWTAPVPRPLHPAHTSVPPHVFECLQCPRYFASWTSPSSSTTY